jgi:hypothetical protein
LRSAESHTLQSKADVDVIPFEVVSGRATASSCPTRPRGDLRWRPGRAWKPIAREKCQSGRLSLRVDRLESDSRAAPMRVTRNDDGVAPRAARSKSTSPDQLNEHPMTKSHLYFQPSFCF